MTTKRSLTDFTASAQPDKPKSLSEAFQTVAAPIAEGSLSASDEALLGGPVDPEEDPATAEPTVDPLDEDEAPNNDIPEWVVMPTDAKFKIPPGRAVTFVRFRAAWTDRPEKGDRQCMLWNLTDTDEKLALKRTGGDSTRMLNELTKQTIRVVDGQRVDWSRGPLSNIEKFWHEIGAKCRSQLSSIYHKTHNLSREEAVDFFAHCVAVRGSVG